MKYRSIVISGQIASGTSTAAKTLSKKLNLPYRCAGDFFRKFAIDHNIPLHLGVPDEIDIKMDKENVKFVKKGGILDSHYAGYFNRNDERVLKILLTCDDKTRYQRAQNRTHTHQETIGEIRKREENLDKKFRKLYANENFLNPKFFDLVIDTTNTTKEEVPEKILEKFYS